jgi:hypothetical protein
MDDETLIAIRRAYAAMAILILVFAIMMLDIDRENVAPYCQWRIIRRAIIEIGF